MTAVSTSPVAPDSFPAAITMADLVGDLLVALAGPDRSAVGAACARIGEAIGPSPGPDMTDLAYLAAIAALLHIDLADARRRGAPTAEKLQVAFLSIEEALELHLERLSPAEGGAA